jgi:hypothetical protein
MSPCNEADEEGDEKDDKEYPSNARSRPCQTAKAQDCGNQRDHQKRHGPTQHNDTSLIKILNKFMTDYMSNRRATVGGVDTQLKFYITINIVLFMKRILWSRLASETSVMNFNNK